MSGWDGTVLEFLFDLFVLLIRTVVVVTSGHSDTSFCQLPKTLNIVLRHGYSQGFNAWIQQLKFCSTTFSEIEMPVGDLVQEDGLG